MGKKQLHEAAPASVSAVREYRAGHWRWTVNARNVNGRSVQVADDLGDLDAARLVEQLLRRGDDPAADALAERRRRAGLAVNAAAAADHARASGDDPKRGQVQ